MSDNHFVFGNSCVSVRRDELPVIEELAKTDYTCAIDQISNIMVVSVNISKLKTQKQLRFETQI
jgi:hypothetical protein